MIQKREEERIEKWEKKEKEEHKDNAEVVLNHPAVFLSQVRSDL